MFRVLPASSGVAQKTPRTSAEFREEISEKKRSRAAQEPLKSRSRAAQEPLKS